MKREGYSGAMQLEKIKIESRLQELNSDLTKAVATTAPRPRKPRKPKS